MNPASKLTAALLLSALAGCASKPNAPLAPPGKCVANATPVVTAAPTLAHAEATPLAVAEPSAPEPEMPHESLWPCPKSSKQPSWIPASVPGAYVAEIGNFKDAVRAAVLSGSEVASVGDEQYSLAQLLSAPR